jgi:hypothetical protein
MEVFITLNAIKKTPAVFFWSTPARNGIPDRTSERGGQFFFRAHRMVEVAQGSCARNLSGAGYRSHHHHLLLSGSHLFATSLFGLWEMRLPSGLTQAAAKSYTGYFGSLFMGLTLGVVAAPCIGPFVLGLLTWVASMASPWLGFMIFFTLSLGLGLPLFFLAMFSQVTGEPF